MPQGGDPATIAFTLAWETLVHGLRRDFDAQGTVADEVLAVGQRYGIPCWSGVARAFAGSARVSRGHVGALTEVFDGPVLAGGTGNRAAEPMFLALLAEAQQRAGPIDDAAATAAQPRPASPSGTPICIAWTAS